MSEPTGSSKNEKSVAVNVGPAARGAWQSVTGRIQRMHLKAYGRGILKPAFFEALMLWLDAMSDEELGAIHAQICPKPKPESPPGNPDLHQIEPHKLVTEIPSRTKANRHKKRP